MNRKKNATKTSYLILITNPNNIVNKSVNYMQQILGNKTFKRANRSFFLITQHSKKSDVEAY
jgi:hypothetical protein